VDLRNLSDVGEIEEIDFFEDFLKKENQIYFSFYILFHPSYSACPETMR